jgi:hypothetical protein
MRGARSIPLTPPRRGLAAVAAVLALVGVAGGCADDGEMPGAASNCEELMEAASDVVRVIVADLQGTSETDLRATNPDDPFGALQRPLDPYRARADELGCDRTELRRAACRTYRDIAPNGPAAEEFLAQMLDDCVN